MRHRERMAKLGAKRASGAPAAGIDVEARLGRLEEGVARLQDLERNVDAIALEIERIGEGQRFLTKLLAEARPPEKR